MKLNIYPNDRPQIMLVAAPVLHELDIEFKKNGCVDNIYAIVLTTTHTNSPNNKHRYA